MFQRPPDGCSYENTQHTNREVERHTKSGCCVVAAFKCSHHIRRKGRKGGESTAETHAEKPGGRAGAEYFQQDTHQQRSRGIDHKCSGGKSQQGLFRQPNAGNQIPRYTTQSTSDSYCYDFSNHSVLKRLHLKVCKFTQKIVANRKFFRNFCDEFPPIYLNFVFVTDTFDGRDVFITDFLP